MPPIAYTKVTPHIYMLDLPLFGGRLPTAVWLVQDADGWLMVDAGGPGFEKVVLEQTLIQTGGQRPHTLLLTHGHLDHAAAAQRIREQWKIPIAAGRDEIPYLIGPARYNSVASKNLLYKLQLTPPALVGRNVQIPLDDGRRLGEVQVFHVTGHAPGMLVLLHPADRALIAADAFTNIGKLGDPPLPFTYDMALNRVAQARLVTLDFDHLLASHGAPILNTGRQQARDFVDKHAKKPRLARPAPAKSA